MIKNTLITARTALIPFESNEATLFHSLNTDPFVRRFLWDNKIISEELANDLLAENAIHFSENNYGLWKIKLTSADITIGYTGLWCFFEEAQPQLIYAILEQYTGSGIATECALEVVNYAFERLKFDYLIAATDELHTESQKVARRLGMRFTEKRIEDDKATLFFRIDKEE